MYKRKFRFAIMAVSALVLSFSACKKDDDELPEVEENELITTLKLKFTNKAAANDVKTFSWKDTDGPGGNAPVIEQIVLEANKSYTLSIDEVWNEAASPAEDVREEIADDADDHLFVYKPAPAGLLSITITDKDVNNLPIGLTADAVTAAAGTGTLQIVLRHQPNVKNGTETPGSTDLDATFAVKIQ